MEICFCLQLIILCKWTQFFKKTGFLNQNSIALRVAFVFKMQFFFFYLLNDIAQLLVITHTYTEFDGARIEMYVCVCV